MNITVSENASLSLTIDITVHVALLPNLISLILRLPINIYILQLIISGNLITSEFYTFNGAIFEVIGLYDLFGVAIFVFPNVYLLMIKSFFLGFIFTGRPCLLALICVERYLAVVKPVAFLRLKPLKYKVAMSGIIWVWTLASGACSLILVQFKVFIVWQVVACCLLNLYCCIATLLALQRPSPGAGQREGMSNVKQKAFRIILIITVTVFLMYVPLALVVLLKIYIAENQFPYIINVCSIFTGASGFIQALLFLQRSGKLSFIKWPFIKWP